MTPIRAGMCQAERGSAEASWLEEDFIEVRRGSSVPSHSELAPAQVGASLFEAGRPSGRCIASSCDPVTAEAVGRAGSAPIVVQQGVPRTGVRLPWTSSCQLLDCGCCIAAWPVLAAAPFVTPPLALQERGCVVVHGDVKAKARSHYEPRRGTRFAPSFLSVPVASFPMRPRSLRRLGSG